MSTAAQRLRERLGRPGPVLVAGAHSPLSARLAERAGFDAIWASGFEISAAHGVPDANILTMAEQLQAAREMARATPVPVIADCDNGFGNAINVIRTVQDYEADGIAGICIEDNIFPKRCSFYAGVRRELAGVEEHAGKIRAACASRRSRDFLIIARTEAFIAGWGLDEALLRANAYADAGADMILVHSKEKVFDELRRFAERWDRPTPLVSVPTIYKHMTAEELEQAGYKMVIFANHGLRSSIKAMRETYAALVQGRRAAAVDDRVVPLEDVYDLIGVSEMKRQEEQFLPAGTSDVTAVILAAGASEELGELTADRPKAMLEVRGKTILEHQVAALNACGIKDIAVVRGYQKDKIALTGLRYYDNDAWETEGELSSLLVARPELKGRTVVLYGDVLFDPGILEKLLKSPADVAVLVDRAWTDARKQGYEPATPPDLVALEGAGASNGHRFLPGEEARVTRIGRTIGADKAQAEFVGLCMLSDQGARRLLDTWGSCVERGGSGKFQEAASLRQASLTDMLQELIGRGEAVQAVSVYKGWSEVDTFADYQQAWKQPTRG